jgi:hypothetical protein
VRISRVLVQNFRNFVHLEIDPFPASAVIVGENGIGKSNLLHALRLVLDPDLPDSARRLRAEDICEHAGLNLEDGVEVRVEVDFTAFDGDLGAEAIWDGCYVDLEPPTTRVTYVFRPLRPSMGPRGSSRGMTTTGTYSAAPTRGPMRAGSGATFRCACCRRFVTRFTNC